MTEAYRIKKVRAAARMELEGAGTIDGLVFLQPSMPYRSGPQRLLELLNEPDPFFPFETSTGDFLLVAKDRVVRMDCDDLPDETGPEVGHTVRVMLHLHDDRVVTGALAVEVRAERPRLLDFLNAYDARFVALRTDEGSCYINRAYIAAVKQPDSGTSS